MTTSNDIVLRPRFKFDLKQNNETILNRFENSKLKQSQFIVSRIDDHVFIKFPKKDQHFWSPQLHLEINKIDDENCTLYGLFGPNPTVWTLFIFLHFLVAGLFLAFGIWAYSNWRLNLPYNIQTTLMVLMIVIWIALYFAGSYTKTSSKVEMQALKKFMETIINNE
ncbi:hypothetical protein [Siansivirga zeaxanthinifaciens]|uniref:GTP-binding protein n=1 Tax=Siansivirga zeaxanthinifaciens CC-SAMT-1 TaxID=1454006 RepID=A0A0C5W5D5_9FLAO|nr:hypothetical protein [Siansivirga zeaxanthinifaciens]AJR02348.1 hypothetical protein AW14_00505 [Siansivirga zeaxanthinifaciens CC-SAMT-1]